MEEGKDRQTRKKGWKDSGAATVGNEKRNQTRRNNSTEHLSSIVVH